jgi:hypothetical protein
VQRQQGRRADTDLFNYVLFSLFLIFCFYKLILKGYFPLFFKVVLLIE